MKNKAMIWGAMPFEQDGGAIVTFYQLRQMHEMKPDFKFSVVPKIWDQAKPELMPYLNWYQVHTKYLGEVPRNIPKIMKRNKIPLLILWHIPWEYFPIIDKVHKLGYKVLNWQTIHWVNDVLFMSDKLQDFDWWVPPTQYAKDTLVEVGKLNYNKMTVIPHGVDLSCYYPPNMCKSHFWRNKEFGIKEDQKVILFIGRTQKTKGIEQLMLCARRLCHEFNCHIIFKAGIHAGVWKSREIGYLLKQMTRWDKRIHLITEWKSPEYHEQLVASSDIICCPSGHEGFSLVPLEGMACKKAVCLTDIPVHRELIGGRNGECGLLMPPSEHTECVNDIQSVKVPSRDMIYGTLKFMLENKDEAEVMASNGLNRAKDHYSLESVCKKWFDLFEEMSIL